MPELTPEPNSTDSESQKKNKNVNFIKVQKYAKIEYNLSKY
jgi:hypothetical protein